VLLVPAEVRAERVKLMADLAVARFQCGQQEEARLLGVPLFGALLEFRHTCNQIFAVARQFVDRPAEEYQVQRHLWATSHAFFTYQQCLTSHALAAAVLGRDDLDVSAMSECPDSSTRVEVILPVQMVIIKR
jgi:hypothetical protein